MIFSSLFLRELTLNIPAATRRNGTLFIHIFVMPLIDADVKADPDTVDSILRKASNRALSAYVSYPLTIYREPDPEAFQLLSSETPGGKKINPLSIEVKVVSHRTKYLLTVKENKTETVPSVPVSHFKPALTFNLVTETLKLPVAGLPADIGAIVNRPRQSGLTLPPLLTVDVFSDRLASQIRVNDTFHAHTFKLKYEPVSFGKFRVWRQFELSIATLTTFGFTEKDVDEVR